MSVLANRYASREMREIWSPENKIKAERRLWIEVMRFQAKALNIPTDAIAKYESVLEKIDLVSIDEREKKSRHDVKARIDEFNSLAGHEYIHLGMTSRDLTENIELLQMKKALEIVRRKSLILLKVLNEKIESYVELPIVGRTHNVPAQVTTLGRRFATWAEELLFALENLDDFSARLPLKGVKGAVGTSSDLRLLLGDSANLIDKEIEETLGFSQSLIAPSQVYPRSIDFEVISGLVQIAMSPSNIATNIRLMSGFGLVAEQFYKDQTGSSAMPHKVNPRLSERINSLVVILKGFLTMSAEVAGDQWNEGDVSCSAVRRVSIPESFMTVDGILDTSIAILMGLQVFETEIERELLSHMPELTSTVLLVSAVQAGVGREVAHKRLKEHALAGLTDKRNKGINTFFERVTNDASLKIDQSNLDNLLRKPLSLSGAAVQQALEVSKKINNRLSDYGESLSQQRPLVR